MVRIRGGHTDPSVSREAKLRASSPQDSSQPLKPLPFYHRLLHPLSHQYAAFHLREPGPQALERLLGMRSLIIRPFPILNILPTLLWKPSSRGLWSPRRPLRAIQIVEPNHFTPSFISTLRPCDSSRSFGIHLDCSRGTISSAL
ncbi:hypothetical protein AAG906_030909 [Vitis piasezkii]